MKDFAVKFCVYFGVFRSSGMVNCGSAPIIACFNREPLLMNWNWQYLPTTAWSGIKGLKLFNDYCKDVESLK